MDDAEISALIHAAESRAVGTFAEIVRCFQHDVQRAVSRHLGRMPDIDNATQGVSVPACQDRDTYQSAVSLRAWLLGIASHRALDRLRGKTVPPSTGRQTDL
jgi:DNA-directed RNA polymerase specialized sigma24 family protein